MADGIRNGPANASFDLASGATACFDAIQKASDRSVRRVL